MATKLYNFRLDELVIGLLDRMSALLGINRSQAVRQSVAVAGAILQSSRSASIARLTALRDRYGDDAKLMVRAFAGEDGDARAQLVIDGEMPDGLVVFPVTVEAESKVLIFLSFARDWTTFADFPVLARLGDASVLIPEALLPLGELPWPADPTKGIVIRLGDLDQIISADPTLKEPVEA